MLIKLSHNLEDPSSETVIQKQNSRKKSTEKQNVPSYKLQVKGKQSLFLPVSWLIKPSKKVSELSQVHSVLEVKLKMIP